MNGYNRQWVRDELHRAKRCKLTHSAEMPTAQLIVFNSLLECMERIERRIAKAFPDEEADALMYSPEEWVEPLEKRHTDILEGVKG